MKLYLCSYGVPTPHDLATLVGKDLPAIRIALIPNAGDYYGGRARMIKRRDAIDYFSTIGLRAEIVDLAEYPRGEGLQLVLADYDVVWAGGGNTFMLREAMEHSNFGTSIRQLLADGIVYGGASAGAAVAGTNIRGIELADNPEFAETVYWDGLNLIDRYILPHVGSSYFGEAIEQIQQMHADDPTVVALTDEQAFIVDGDTSKIVSAHHSA